jgi:hypothetical protein
VLYLRVNQVNFIWYVLYEFASDENNGINWKTEGAIKFVGNCRDTNTGHKTQNEDKQNKQIMHRQLIRCMLRIVIVYYVKIVENR